MENRQSEVKRNSLTEKPSPEQIGNRPMSGQCQTISKNAFPCCDLSRLASLSAPPLRERQATARTKPGQVTQWSKRTNTRRHSLKQPGYFTTTGLFNSSWSLGHIDLKGVRHFGCHLIPQVLDLWFHKWLPRGTRGRSRPPSALLGH